MYSVLILSLRKYKILYKSPVPGRQKLNSSGKNISMTYGIRPKGASIRFTSRENRISSKSLALDFNNKFPQIFVNHIV